MKATSALPAKTAAIRTRCEDREAHRDAPSDAPSGARAGVVESAPAPAGEIASPTWIVADQAIVSGGSFLTTVLLGRFAGTEQLGVYRMGMSILVMALSVPSALVWTPFNAHSASMRARRLARYSASARLHVVWIAIAASLCALGAALFAKPIMQPLFAALALSVVAILLRENVRRMAFAHMDLRRALLIDALGVVVQIAGLYALYVWGALSGATAYLAVGFSCIIALAANRASVPAAPPARLRTAVRDFRENWRLSRFVLVGAILYACTNGAYPWILAHSALGPGGHAGEQAVGMLAKAESAIFLANPLMIAAANFLGPAAAHALRSGGAAELRRMALQSTTLIVVAMSLFAAALAMWGEALIALVFDGPATDLQPTIVALSLAQIASAALIPVRSGLLALHEGRCMVWGGMLRFGCAATIGLWAVARWGGVGVGVGLLSGDLAALIMKWIVFQRRTSQFGLLLSERGGVR